MLSHDPMTFTSRDDGPPTQHINGLSHDNAKCHRSVDEPDHAASHSHIMHGLKVLADWASEHIEIVGFGAGSIVIFLVILVAG